MKKILAAVAVGLGLALVPTAAYAGSSSSDSPTPYTVDGAGIKLPDGVAFLDGGHVNITSSKGGKGLHFESLNNQPSGQWIGKSFIPWSAFGLYPCDTVSWVQVSLYSEHYGEGGQPAVTVQPCGTVPEIPVKPEPRPFSDAGETFTCEAWTVWSKEGFYDLTLVEGVWVENAEPTIVSELSSLVPTNEAERIARGCVTETVPPVQPPTPEAPVELAETGFDLAPLLWFIAGGLILGGISVWLAGYKRNGDDS